MSGGAYGLKITPAAQKELDRLPKQQRSRVDSAIAALAIDPRPVGSRKLQGVENTYRIRVGNYRIIYRIYDDELVVVIIAVGDRKDIYRG
jgi:mRNA interferase RelE/StbE